MDQALSGLKDVVPAGAASDFLASLQREAVPLVAAQTATAVTAAAVRASTAQAVETSAGGEKSSSGVLSGLAAIALGVAAYYHRSALRTALAEVRPTIPPCHLMSATRRLFTLVASGVRAAHN